MKAIITFVLSPTRSLARLLIDSDVIQGFRSMLAWNAIFYVLLGISVLIISRFPLAIKSSWWAPYLVIAVCIIRVDELLLAFYGDALPAELRKKHKGLPIDRRGRVILLSLAYIEIMGWFGLQYVAIEALYPGKMPFNKAFSSIADAFFLSGVTLTTLGSGDIYPTEPMARFATLYEALIGIVFIALGLAAYIGASDQNQAVQPDGISTASPSRAGAPSP